MAADTMVRAGLARPVSLLVLYRHDNGPTLGLVACRSDFGAALTEPSPSAHSRAYVGYWETRNLCVIVSIHDMLGRNPGARMLAIVGASHTAYCDVCPNQMHDVLLADAKNVPEAGARTRPDDFA